MRSFHLEGEKVDKIPLCTFSLWLRILTQWQGAANIARRGLTVYMIILAHNWHPPSIPFTVSIVFSHSRPLICFCGFHFSNKSLPPRIFNLSELTGQSRVGLQLPITALLKCWSSITRWLILLCRPKYLIWCEAFGLGGAQKWHGIAFAEKNSCIWFINWYKNIKLEIHWCLPWNLPAT